MPIVRQLLLASMSNLYVQFLEAVNEYQGTTSQV